MGKTLQFPLSRIPDGGIDVSLDLEADDLGETWFRASRLRLVGRLAKAGADEAAFRGRVSGRLLLECSLGLAEFPHAFDEPVAVFFSRAPKAIEAGGEIELSEEDIEVAYVENGAADLAAPVRDQIALAIPIQPRCPEKCLGEAPDRCRRLDAGESVGAGAEADPRWGALRGWEPKASA